MSEPKAIELDDFSYVKYTDDTLISLVCFEGRHAECPQVDNEAGEPQDFPFDGWCCECTGCPHGPLEGRQPDPVRWEVAFGPVETSDGADAEAAATAAVAEGVFERDRKYYTSDPNPSVWVRCAGSTDPWQQVYEDPAAIEAAVAAIRVREYGDG
jgi:hypothetical protein